jgi:energy-converting hydrogenase Eha subunit A
MSALLLRPLLYLRVKHDSSTLPWMNWGVPTLAAAALTVGFAVAAPTVNAFHAGGVFERMLGFLQSLPGFYLAALAAVATFNSPHLDSPMPGVPPKASIVYHGQLVEVELSRRRFLSLMFSYLTALSFAITLALVLLLPIVDPVRDALHAATVPALRAAIAAVLLIFVSQLLVITLWGLYYLGERMHTPD